MPNWLKYLLSGVSGFATAGGAVASSGGTTKATIISGAIGTLITLSNLAVSAPADTKHFEK